MDEEKSQRKDVVEAIIGDMIKVGLHVLDVNGVKIGPVHRYSLDAGYMVVEHGVLAKQRFYVPFHLVRSITPKEIYLAVSKAALADTYYLPPIMKPVMEEWTNPLTGRTEMGILHELRSGYDGRPVRIKPVSVDEVTTRITVGMTVVDVDDDYVGETIAVDGDLLTVQDDFAEHTICTVPVGVVERVDSDNLSVTLLLPSHDVSLRGQSKDTDAE